MKLRLTTPQLVTTVRDRSLPTNQHLRVPLKGSADLSGRLSILHLWLLFSRRRLIRTIARGGLNFPSQHAQNTDEHETGEDTRE